VGLQQGIFTDVESLGRLQWDSSVYVSEANDRMTSDYEGWKRAIEKAK